MNLGRGNFRHQWIRGDTNGFLANKVLIFHRISIQVQQVLYFCLLFNCLTCWIAERWTAEDLQMNYLLAQVEEV